MALINERDLARINEQRAAKGLPPLTLAQARMAIDAASDRPRDDSFDWLTFLVMYEVLSSGDQQDKDMGGDPNPPAPDYSGGGGTGGGAGASGDWTPPSDPTPQAPETDGGGKGSDPAPSYDSPSISSDAPSDSGGGGGGSE